MEHRIWPVRSTDILQQMNAFQLALIVSSLHNFRIDTECISSTLHRSNLLIFTYLLTL
jgi:hypothetical protein